METDSGHPPSTWIGVVILGVLVLWQLSQLGRDSVQKRPLNLVTLWLSALFYAALAASVIALQPPHGSEWVWLEAGAGLGAAFGWWRGKTIEIEVHPVTGVLTTRTSLTTVAFLIGVVALRYGLGYVLLIKAQAGTMQVSVQVITSTLLAFAVGLVVMQRVEMTLRATLLLGRAVIERATVPESAAMGRPPASGQTAPAKVRTKLSTARLVMLAAAVFAVIVIIGLAMPR